MTELKYCSLASFLRQNHKNFYQALEDTCVLPLLAAKRSGKTLLLYPKKELDKIVDDSYNSKTQDVAVQRMKSMIVNDYLPDVASWKRTGKSLSNGLFQRVEMVTAGGATETKKASVILKGEDGNVELTPYNYTDLYADKINKSAVWEINKGKLSLSSEKIQSFFKRDDADVEEKGKRGRSRSRGVRGGADDIFENQITPTELYKQDCENMCKMLQQKKLSSNPIAEHVLSFMVWSSKNSPSTYYALDGTFSKMWYTPEVAAFTFGIYNETPENTKWLNETGGFYISQSSNINEEFLRVVDLHTREYLVKNPSENLDKFRNLKEIRLVLLKDPSKPGLRKNIETAYNSNIEKIWIDELRLCLTAKVHEIMLSLKNNTEPGEFLSESFRCFMFYAAKVYTKPTSKAGLMILGSSQEIATAATVHISTTLKFVRTVYMFSPILTEDLDDANSVEFLGTFSDADEQPITKEGRINTSLFNYAKHALDELKSRTPSYTHFTTALIDKLRL